VDTLKKLVDTPMQSGLVEADARRANVLGVYLVSDPALVSGKRILLIDDIITTRRNALRVRQDSALRRRFGSRLRRACQKREKTIKKLLSFPVKFCIIKNTVSRIELPKYGQTDLYGKRFEV
jgi:hypothetical protein